MNPLEILPVPQNIWQKALKMFISRLCEALVKEV